MAIYELKMSTNPMSDGVIDTLLALRLTYVSGRPSCHCIDRQRDLTVAQCSKSWRDIGAICCYVIGYGLLVIQYNFIRH
jgi:hypothetical protein